MPDILATHQKVCPLEKGSIALSAFYLHNCLIMEQLTDRELEEYCFLHLALNDLWEAESAFDLAIQYRNYRKALFRPALSPTPGHSKNAEASTVPGYQRRAFYVRVLGGCGLLSRTRARWGNVVRLSEGATGLPPSHPLARSALLVLYKVHPVKPQTP